MWPFGQPFQSSTANISERGGSGFGQTFAVRLCVISTTGPNKKGEIYIEVWPHNDCLIGISDAFSALFLRVFVIFPTCSLYPQQKCAYSALHSQAWTDIIQVHARRHLPSAVPWISEDRLLYNHTRMRKLSMYLWWSLYTLYLHAGQVRVTVGDSVLDNEDVPLVELIMLYIYTRARSDRRQLRSW